MKNTILIILCLLIILGCAKEIGNEVDEKKEDTVYVEIMDTRLALQFVDGEGRDLLDTVVENSFHHSGIFWSGLDGDKKVGYDTCFVGRYDGVYFLYTGIKPLFSNTDTIGSFVALLHLSENVVDTVKTEWISSFLGFYKTAVYYNNELKWKRSIGYRLPIIVKK